MLLFWRCLSLPVDGGHSLPGITHLQPQHSVHSPKLSQSLQDLTDSPDSRLQDSPGLSRPAACRASRPPCSTSGWRRRASARWARRWSTWTRTTRLCGAAASSPAACSRTTRSRPWPPPWDSRSWVRVPTRSEGWPGRDRRSVPVSGFTVRCRDWRVKLFKTLQTFTV